MRCTRLALATVVAFALAAFATSASADGPPAAQPATSASEIVAAHDRALIRDLDAYLRDHPKALDHDQAYMTLFNKAIDHDWFADNEPVARRYLAEKPDGPVQSLARIVATMARAQAGDFVEARKRFEALLKTLGKPEQEEFAATFTDSLAAAALSAGEHETARAAYDALLKTYADSPTLRQKVKDDLARIDRVGKPAPTIAARDLKGDAFRLESLRGKYVLVDFWATWCAPCVAELPRLKAAYEKYHPRGFEVVGVSLDESRNDVLDFVRARGIVWRQIHNASSGGDLVDAFGVGSIPSTFLIDPQGTITRIELRGPALDDALAKLFATTAR